LVFLSVLSASRRGAHRRARPTLKRRADITKPAEAGYLLVLGRFSGLRDFSPAVHRRATAAQMRFREGLRIAGS